MYALTDGEGRPVPAHGLDTGMQRQFGRERLGRSSGADGTSGGREFELQPEHGLGSGRFKGFGCNCVRLGRSSGADLGLEDESSDFSQINLGRTRIRTRMVDLFQLTVWIQAYKRQFGFDLDSFGGWDNVDDVGFGGSLHEQLFPQLS